MNNPRPKRQRANVESGPEGKPAYAHKDCGCRGEGCIDCYLHHVEQLNAQLVAALEDVLHVGFHYEDGADLTNRITRRA
jgi:hypothetical protein